MYLLYSLLLTLGFILLLPRFIFDAFRHGKYITGMSERFGNVPKIPRADSPVIWFHCVSVGETQAARSLVRSLREKYSARVVVSTTTITGQRVAREIFQGEVDTIFYFPIDWGWTVRRVLTAIKPAAVLIMETELWPNLLREARRRSIPVALVNGRISDTSFPRYKFARPFFRRVLRDLTIAMMQSEEDARRIRKLGAGENQVIVTGNLKFDSSEIPIEAEVTEKFGHRFGFTPAEQLIVAASTHAPEERIVLDAFKQIRLSHPAARLLIAPRHPERFPEVAMLLRRSGLSWVARSGPPSREDESCAVILLDTVGELRAVYPLADLVFIGGSIAPHGGHNMLEPASLGTCVIIGPHTKNFAAITTALLNERAMIQLPELEEAQYAKELGDVFDEMLSHQEIRCEIGKRALEVCRRNRGATEQTLLELSGIFNAMQIEPFSALNASTAK